MCLLHAPSTLRKSKLVHLKSPFCWFPRAQDEFGSVCSGQKAASVSANCCQAVRGWDLAQRLAFRAFQVAIVFLPLLAHQKNRRRVNSPCIPNAFGSRCGAQCLKPPMCQGHVPMHGFLTGGTHHWMRKPDQPRVLRLLL
ncbi:unnamed protein product [Effrenium voratum]|uniref:Uncharacterized protein n=1 Tax=Effrenium voratum TaxID=2562239 RepID=A0AA36JMZ8_9DINO|nr:unnamed protein product [Effrenium voratum]CAJ1434104.1 unnamed protein product [Effrenium voratum]